MRQFRNSLRQFIGSLDKVSIRYYKSKTLETALLVKVYGILRGKKLPSCSFMVLLKAARVILFVPY